MLTHALARREATRAAHLALPRLAPTTYIRCDLVSTSPTSVTPDLVQPGCGMQYLHPLSLDFSQTLQSCLQDVPPCRILGKMEQRKVEDLVKSHLTPVSVHSR